MTLFPVSSMGKWFVALGVFLCLLPAARSSPASEELLRLVPDDVGFCLVIQDLRGHSEAVLASPFAERFRASPLGQTISTSPEMRRLAEAGKHLEQDLQIGWPELRDDILGDALVLAYRPGPPGKPEEEQGLMLLRARDPVLLARLLDRLNAVQKQSGDLKEVKTLTYHGTEYRCRVERLQEQFYYQHGPLLAWTSQEAMLQQLIDLESQDKGKRETSVARQLERLGAGKALAALWVNPQAFVPQLTQKAAQAGEADKAVLQRILTYWQALEGIALSASPQKTELVLALAIQARPADLPPAGRQLFAAGTQPSELWSCFPDNALLSAAGRVDLVALADFLGEFLTPEARKSLAEETDRRLGAMLGKNIAGEVLPYLGPDWGLCITAPPTAEKGWVPHVLIALRLRSDDRQPSVDKALLDGLNTFAMLAVFAYNSSHADPMSLKTVLQDKVEVRYLSAEKQFSTGLQPAFAYKDGYLLLAGSPEMIRTFARGGAAREAGPAGEIPLLQSSLREVGNYLKDRQEDLARRVAEKEHLSPEEAARRLNDLALNLQLFERMQLSRRTAPGQVAYRLRLQTAQPLEK